MLENAYLLAKIGADTAENEQRVVEILPLGRRGAALAWLVALPPHGAAVELRPLSVAS